MADIDRNDVGPASFAYLFALRTAPTRALCTPVAFSNLGQIPNGFTRLGIFFFAFNEYADAPMATRVDNYLDGMVHLKDPSVDSALFMMIQLGLAEQHSEHELYFSAYKNTTLAELRRLDMSNALVPMDLTFDAENVLHGHNEAVVKIRGIHYLIVGRSRAKVGRLGTFNEMYALFFTERGRQVLVDWLEEQYNRESDRVVHVHLGNPFAPGSQITKPVLIVPRLTLPMSPSYPWSCVASLEALKARLEEDTVLINDYIVPDDENIISCLQIIDLDDEDMVAENIETLTIPDDPNEGDN